MDELFTRFDGVFFEKTRLSLMTMIFREELVAFRRLKESLQLSDGALYTHLEKLIEAGYVQKRKETAGVTARTVYCLSENGHGEFRKWLDFLRRHIEEGE